MGHYGHSFLRQVAAVHIGDAFRVAALVKGTEEAGGGGGHSSKRQLWSLVNILFLLNVRSVLILTVPLPLAVLTAFLFMHYLEITPNIMSLTGSAIAIGVLVDASIVVTENAFRAIGQREVDLRNRRRVTEAVREATRVVGRPIFSPMAIIFLSVMPVFALTGQEGTLFHPLAFTKSFAMMRATLLAVTLVPGFDRLGQRCD